MRVRQQSLVQTASRLRDPTGCHYELKGALCSMALRPLEAGSDPGMIISALATANLCRRCLRALDSMRLPSHSTIFARVHACALTRSESGAVMAGAKVFSAAMPDFPRKKNAKKQRAGRAGLEARWGTSSSTTSSASIAMDVEGNTRPSHVACNASHAP